MFRQVPTLVSRILKTGFGEKGQRTGMFHPALPFGHSKMGLRLQSSGRISDREALWERCGKDERTFNALLKRYDGNLSKAAKFLDSVEKGWLAFRIDSDGVLVTRLTEKGSEEFAKRQDEIHQQSAY